jgi:ABC-type transport system involved in multi-copper enzyme maturation permease subunit
MTIMVLAGLTLREASRRKLLVIVGAITIVLIPLIGWGFSYIPTMCAHSCGRNGAKGPESLILILVAYMFSIIIAVAAPFIAAPAIAGDVDSHVILSILPRPVRRAEVVVGRWLGLAILLGVYTIATALLQFWAVWIADGYSPPHPLFTTMFILGQAIALMTLALLGSTRMAPITCGVVAVILFFVAWIVGIAGQIGAAFGNKVIADIGTVSSLILPTDGLWRGALFNLEPVSILSVVTATREASADPFAVTAPPTTPYVIWAACWVVLVLAGAVWSFNRREI